MITKYLEFLNERNSQKTEEIQNKINRLFTENPEIKPNIKGLYSNSDVIKYVKESPMVVDRVFFDMRSKNDKIKSISVRDSKHKTSNVYYYNSDNITEKDIEKYKKLLIEFHKK
jgi:hypothetical protein